MLISCPKIKKQLIISMEYCDEYSLLNKCNINFIASKKIDIIESDIADKKNIEFAV